MILEAGAADINSGSEKRIDVRGAIGPFVDDGRAGGFEEGGSNPRL